SSSAGARAGRPPCRRRPARPPGSGPAASCSELEAEVDQAILGPVHLAEIKARADEADLVANVVRHERRLGVVEDDALLVVEPARRLVDLGDDRLDAEGEEAVLEQ